MVGRSHAFALSFRGLIRNAAHVAVSLVVVGLVVGTGTQNAFAFGSALPCTSRDSTAAFSQWLDPAQYFLLSNGGFEQGADDWSFSPGASVASGNEPFRVGAPADSNSLALDPGGVAESRTACVTVGEPTVRMFVNTPSVFGATLTIHATVANPTTGLSLETTYTIISGLTPAGWAPTPQIVIPNVVGGILAENVTLRITTGGVPAKWGVDDVYVDPFKQR